MKELYRKEKADTFPTPSLRYTCENLPAAWTPDFSVHHGNLSFTFFYWVFHSNSKDAGPAPR